MTTCIKNCRSCDSTDIEVVFSLGEQSLAGVFRSQNVDEILSGPLTLSDTVFTATLFKSNTTQSAAGDSAIVPGDYPPLKDHTPSLAD